MQILQTFPYNQAFIFNLSRPIVSPQVIFSEFLTAVAGYLQHAQVQSVDFTHLSIDQQGMMALLPGVINNSRITSLNFTSTSMDDETAQQFLPCIPSMSWLQTLNLGHNFLTGWSLQQLTDILMNSTVTALGIGGNFFNASHLQAFAMHLPAMRLRYLDISDTDFSEVDMHDVGTGIANSTLLDLSMVRCQLNSPQVSELFSYLSYSLITCLNWASNEIDYDGLQTMVDFLLKSSITHLILDDNYLDDEAITLLNPILTSNNSLLLKLSLSGNFLTSEGFSQFADAFLNSTLHTLKVARMPISDSGVQALISASENNTYLQNLDVSHTALTSTGANDLLYFVGRSRLTTLDLSDNAIPNVSGAAVYAALNESCLQYLDMRQTQITTTIFQQALPALPLSKLQVLDMSDNMLDDTAAVGLAQQLISSVMNSDDELWSTNNNIDFNRALTDAMPAAALSRLVLSYNQISTIGARALCLILPYSYIQNENLVLTGNPVTSTQTGVSGCPFISETALNATSAATLLTPKIDLIIMIMIAGLTLLYIGGGGQVSEFLFPIKRQLGKFVGSQTEFFRWTKTTQGVEKHENTSISPHCR